MPASAGFTAADVRDQSGKTFIVTGANAGIGLETSRVLALRGARVLLGCRNAATFEAAAVDLRHSAPRADLAWMPLDLADLDSVRAAVAVAQQEARIDGLINNAGVMIPPLMRTRQGFELQLGVNHLGPFALTSLLLPKLAETRGARVVITSSIAHFKGRMEWDDLNAEAGYRRAARYRSSKLANALHLFELDRRLRAANSHIVAVGCHPGVAYTRLGRHVSIAQWVGPLVGRFLNTAVQGAWPTLQAATGDVEPGGYYGPTGLAQARGVSGPARRGESALDPVAARRLWDISVQLTGIDPGLPPA
ncbi:NADP-dependent 3-hydroxy acid dehydrogenase YdfG [Stenotrophomonas maltophilia]|uniref:oxidoreductase n=1 Tax=Stenotrophomonas chelatiphaga TaxID=517011 RepID=UPI000F4B5E11|nr:oxidoreductase [Stenotrophomonas chelatiphaga]MCS4229423.1 NAD(P)-dependent dehydrogenase (short-subunit alcohol dehydrogenase family) [Stenotrophomonas chelatiphaga]ROQ46127.1 NADP-dependent 3-hydroxy acid dehydrogenase YdfG [Stenotrophomonas maltophilia]